MNTRNITLFVLIMAAALSRVIPHPWNFTALSAMALFGGAYIQDKRAALIIPLASLLLSDFVLGYSPAWLSVYAPFALVAFLGWTLHQKVSGSRVAGTALLSSFIFFVVSNFGVWASGQMYTMNFEGLVQCYVMALPFFKNQIVGDLFFSGVMFGGFEFLRRKVPALA